MKYGIAFICISAVQAYYAIWLGDWAYVLFWPAVSFLIVGIGYVANKPSVFAKSEKGRLAIRSYLLLAPYLFYVWLLWQFLRVMTREAPYHWVTDQIVTSRRLLGPEMPEGIDWVLDLTSEFNEPAAIRERQGYRCLPTLDGRTPSCDATLKIVEEISRSGGTILIHCAQGHGRTATLTTILLVHAGAAIDFDDALAQIQRVRPEAKPNRDQIQFAKRFIESMKSKATSD